MYWLALPCARARVAGGSLRAVRRGAWGEDSMLYVRVSPVRRGTAQRTVA